MRVIDHGDHFRIMWEYSHWHAHNLKGVKAIGENRQLKRYVGGVLVDETAFVRAATYVPGDKKKGTLSYWSVPAEFKDQVLQLKYTHRAEFVAKDAIRPEMVGEIAPLPELTTSVKINGTMRPYQERGVARGIQLERFINADEPGLGKTIQAIATVVAKDSFPCVCVVPASLKVNWQREWHKWTDKKAIILDDKIRRVWPQYYKAGYADVFIVNYESIKKFFVEYMPPKDKKGKLGLSKTIVMSPSAEMFKSIIIDELHRCKDSSTMVSKLTLRLAHKKQLRIGLTGTPVMNRPKDLYPQLCIIGAIQFFGERKAFMDRYCEGGSGANNLRELNFLLNKHCFFRRRKADVAKDLPPKVRQTVVCDITTRKEYEKAKNDFVSYLEGLGLSDQEIARKMRGEIMVQMGKLKQISAKGKLPAVKEFIEEILESGEKLVVFANLHEIIDAVADLFPGAVKITGRLTMEQKQASIDAFQNDDKVNLAVCNIKAAGVGLTLTAASRVAFIEYPNHPADCIQCEDRTHRIGQTNTVQATYFLGLNTIDERSFEIIKEKMEIVNAAMGDQESMDMQIVSDLLKTIRS